MNIDDLFDELDAEYNSRLFENSQSFSPNQPDFSKGKSEMVDAVHKFEQCVSGAGSRLKCSDSIHAFSTSQHRAIWNCINHICHTANTVYSRALFLQLNNKLFIWIYVLNIDSVIIVWKDHCIVNKGIVHRLILLSDEFDDLLSNTTTWN